MVWIALWTAIISFTYANCEIALALSISVKMIASLLAMLVFFAILPCPEPETNNCNRVEFCHGLSIVVFNLIFAIAESMIINYPYTSGDDVPFVIAVGVAFYSVLHFVAM